MEKDKNLNPLDFEIDEIESIELIGEVETIDITVDDTHMFYANDIYTHNSGSQEEKIGVDSIADSYAKAAELDLLISLARTDEQKTNGISTVGIVKNRLGQDGFFIENVTLDTSMVRIVFPKDSGENEKKVEKILTNDSVQKREELDDISALDDYSTNYGSSRIS